MFSTVIEVGEAESRIPVIDEGQLQTDAGPASTRIEGLSGQSKGVKSNSWSWGRGAEIERSRSGGHWVMAKFDLDPEGAFKDPKNELIKRGELWRLLLYVVNYGT